MADVSGKFFSAKKVRTGVSPSSPGVEQGETLPPVNPPGTSLNSVGLTMPSAFAVANSPLTSNGTIAVTGAGTTDQYVRGDGSLQNFPSLTGYVPYTGATADVDLGTHDLTAERGTFANNGSSDTLTVNHTSGSGIGVKVTKGGNNEALLVTKTSGSGNAMSVVGGRTALVDLSLSSVSNATGNFLTISGGVVHQRTPSETRSDVGAQAQLNGTGFVKASGTTITYDNSTYQVTSEKGQPNGYASLDSNGKVPLTQINDALIGNVNYQGLWNASTNNPTLVNPPSSGTKGYYYIVSTAGTFASISFEVGDWIISNGSAWQKVDNTDAVSSVFGRTGNVTATNGDYNTSQVTENTNLYFTQARVSANTDVAANTAARHNAVTLGTANGLSLSTQQLSLQLASGSQNGALSSTDWTTFNSKQQALNGTGFVKISGTTISYDNSTYLTTAAAASTYLALAGGTMTGQIVLTTGTGGGIRFPNDPFGGGSDTAGMRLISRGGEAMSLEIYTTNDADDWVNISVPSNDSAKVNGNTIWNAGNITPVPTSRTITINGTTQDLSDNRTYNVGTVTSVTASSPLFSSGGATPNITIQQASGSQNGFLSSTDWTTFNNKQAALNGTGFVKISGTTISYDNSTYYLASNPSAFIALTALSGTAPIQYNNTTGAISITQASGSTNGFLSSTDWNTFNNKTSNVGTVTSVAALTLGTSGTDLSSSVANGTTTPVITLNVPTASASNRGALSAADWTTFNNKENAITAGTTAQYYRGDKTFQTLNTAAVPELTNLYYTEARVSANTDVAANTAARHNAVTLGTANGLSLSTQQLSLGLASSSANGALSSTDWTTFNNKQNALTNPVTGSGTTNYLPKFTGASTIGNSQVFDNGTNVGIGTTSVSGTYEKLAVAGGISIKDNTNAKLEIGRYNTTGAQNSYIKLGANSNSLRFTNNTDIADIMELTNSGNLGLGVTPSAWYNAGNYIAFQVGNASLYGRNSTNSEIYLSANTFYITGTGLPTYITNDFATSYQQNDGVHSWYTAPSGTAGNAISFTQAMTLGTNSGLSIGTPSAAPSQGLLVQGNVGIGVSPDVKLDVLGTSDTSDVVRIRKSSTGSRRGALGTQSGVGCLDLYNDSTELNIRLLAQGNSYFNGGNVGIGTASPSQKLEVSGGAIIASGFGNRAAGTGKALEIGMDGTNAVLQAYDRTANAFIPIYISSSQTIIPTGNVLIGTTTDAGFKLDVNGTGRFSGTITSSTGNNTRLFTTTSATTGYLYADIINTGGRIVWGVESSTGGTLGTGYDAYASVIASNTTANLNLGTNGSKRVTIDGSTGAATFSSSLSVNSSASSIVSLTVSGNTGDGVRQRFLNQSASGLFNFQIGTHISAANAFEIGTSSTTDGTSFNNIFRILNTGAATFSSSVTATSGFIMNSQVSSLYETNGALSYYSTTNGVYLNGAGPNGWLRLNGAGSENDRNSINIYGSASSYPDTINFNTSGFTRLTIASTGAATFSNNVTASGSGNIVIQAISSNNFPLFQLQDNRSGGAVWNIEGGRTLGNLQFRSNIFGNTVLELASSGAATFSNTIYLPNSIAGRTSQIEFGNLSSGDLLGMPNQTSTFYLSYGTNNINFRNDNFGEILRLSNNGAATFSSSVTASSIIRSGGTSSQYLMADGSVSTLTNPVTGTGTAGQVAYWSSGSAITGESNLFWDATNDRLGIGRNNPSQRLDILGSGTVYANIENSSASIAAVITKNTSKTFSTGLVTDYWAVIDATSGSNTRLIITSGGNVLINTFTDVTDATLNVNGNIRTAAPTGGSAENWKLGNAVNGTVNANRLIRVEIAGVGYDLVARQII